MGRCPARLASVSAAPSPCSAAQRRPGPPPCKNVAKSPTSMYNTLRHISHRKRGQSVSVDLSHVDLLRARMNVGYDEARAALEATSGDVVAALGRLEQARNSRTDFMTVGSDVIDEVQRLLDAGVIRKIRVKLGKRTLKEIPVSLTAVGAILIGLLAVLVTQFVIEVDRD
jgi:hypothetical protein